VRKPLFRKKGKAIVLDESVECLPSFMELTGVDGDRWKLYIALCYDFFSPYKNLPLEKRKQSAYTHAFRKNFTYEPKEIQGAVEDYRSLQYDPLRVTHGVYRKKQDELNKLLDDNLMTMDNAQAQLDLMVDSEKFIKTILFLEKQIITEEKNDEVELQAGKSLSFLEQANESTD
jgi:hypothetical protein